MTLETPSIDLTPGAYIAGIALWAWSLFHIIEALVMWGWL